MKLVFKILVLFLFSGCIPDDNEDHFANEWDLEHFKLDFPLDEPNHISNDLAKGHLDRNVRSVVKQQFDNFPTPAERYWEFEYIPDTDKVSKMTFYLPHYSSCEKEQFNFHYNQEGLLDSIVSKRTNLCLEFEVDRDYTFNYNARGVIKSVFMDNDFFLEENYFSYYSNGKIKEIYNDFHGRGDQSGANSQRFYYDSEFRNVIKVEHFRRGTYHHTYEYFYDTNKNPFKDFFIAVSVFLPYIGPAYLSENNVIKEVKKYDNNFTDNVFPHEYLFNYSVNNLTSYSDKDQSKLPYILYRVNP